MKKTSAISLDAESAGCSAGIFRVSTEGNRGNYTADITASNRQIFSISNCVIFFRSKAVFFILDFLIFDNSFLLSNN
jgi:hypothetical protein